MKVFSIDYANINLFWTSFVLDWKVRVYPTLLTSWFINFNDLLFSGKVVSSCSWWRSHHCLCSVLWTFYLFRLMTIYLHRKKPFFCTCLALRRLLLGESSWVVHGTLWCVQLRRITPTYLLGCLADVQCNASVMVLIIRIRQRSFFAFFKLQ